MRRNITGLLTAVLVACASMVVLAPAAQSKPVSAPADQTEKADKNHDKVFDDLASELSSASDSTSANVIVTLSGKVDSARVHRLQERIGAFDAGKVFDIAHGFSATLTKGQIEALAQSSDVVQVEADSTVTALNTQPQNDFGVTEVRTTTGADGADATPGCDAGDQVVAVIDTGIDANHPMLAGKVMAFRDWVGAAGGPAAPYDDNGHGTHVSGTIAGVGTEGGVAPGACLVGLKVLDQNGSGSMSNVNAAIDWAVANKDAWGIDVISMSLGTSGCSNGTDSTSIAVNNAVNANIVVTVAAGNSGPAACTVGSPGAAPSAITVAAMADLGQQGYALASFSSRGGAALPNKPDVAAPGVNVVSAAANTTGLTTMSGTSMATPFVAGVAALMRDANPGMTAAAVKSTILSTAIDWGSAGKDTEYGAGRLDGFAAVAAAAGSGTPSTTTPHPLHTSYSGSLGPTGAIQDYVVNVTDLSVPLAATLINTSFTTSSASTPDLDLYVLNPNGVELGRGYTTSRQETVKVQPTMTGAHIVRVKSYTGTGAYQLDVSAGVTVDGSPPTILSITPADGTTGVSASTAVSVAFSEPMNQSSAQNAFKLDNASNGAFSWSGNTMTFQPSAALGGGSHTVTVGATATDSSGNALAAPGSSTFSVSASVVQSASSVTKNVGGSSSGSISSFNADDTSYYKVSSSNRVVQYTLTFSNVPLNAANVQLTFKSKNSRSVSQTITTSWTGTVVDTRNVSTTEVLVQQAVPGAVAGTLTVTIREQGSTSSSFSHYGDWARISYTVG